MRALHNMREDGECSRSDSCPPSLRAARKATRQMTSQAAAINATLTGIATDIPREAGEEVVVLLHHPAVIAGAGVPSRGEAGAGVEPLGLELFDTKRPIGTSMSVIAVC